jgi:hypothetical protein
MRRRYVYDKETDSMVEVTSDWSPPSGGLMVMPDIKPYKSMITGETITSRSKHRQHLKDHDCIEVGNETEYMIRNRIRPSAPPGLREELMKAAYKHGIFK